MDEVISGVCNNPNRGMDRGTDETIHCCELVIVETKYGNIRFIIIFFVLCMKFYIIKCKVGA